MKSKSREFDQKEKEFNMTADIKTVAIIKRRKGEKILISNEYDKKVMEISVVDFCHDLKGVNKVELVAETKVLSMSWGFMYADTTVKMSHPEGESIVLKVCKCSPTVCILLVETPKRFKVTRSIKNVSRTETNLC